MKHPGESLLLPPFHNIVYKDRMKFYEVPIYEPNQNFDSEHWQEIIECGVTLVGGSV